MRSAFIDLCYRLDGRIALHYEQVAIMIPIFAQYPGDHVEIGTLYGGSAILTALTKKVGHIFAIDPLSEHGYYGGEDKWHGRPSAERLKGNLEEFGVADRVTHVDEFSSPFPLPGHRFDTAFIDGDHTYEGCKVDWYNLRDRVNHVIVFHDTHLTDVKLVFEMARHHSDWERHLEYGGVGKGIGVLKRKGSP